MTSPQESTPVTNVVSTTAPDLFVSETLSPISAEALKELEAMSENIIGSNPNLTLESAVTSTPDIKIPTSVPYMHKSPDGTLYLDPRGLEQPPIPLPRLKLVTSVELGEANPLPEMPNLEQVETIDVPHNIKFPKPKTKFPEFIKTFTGKLYPDYEPVKEPVTEIPLNLICWQYRGSTLRPPVLPDDHKLHRYGFVTSFANISHEVTWRNTMHNVPTVREVISAAAIIQCIADGKCVTRLPKGDLETAELDFYDLERKLVLPMYPQSVVRAERTLMCHPNNSGFKRVFDIIPFIPLQFELPSINFAKDFKFNFRGLVPGLPTRDNLIQFIRNYSNIRFNGQTFAANCRHVTSHWDEHPWCVNCLIRGGDELCLPVDDETEEGSCPFCFIMGPNAIKARKEKWQYWEEKFKATGVASESTSNKLKVDIRTQFDADLITSKCDYNPDWDLGYFGYCRPSWAIPIFMSWQEYWFAKFKQVNLLERVNDHREIFCDWANARIESDENICGFKRFTGFTRLTSLATSKTCVYQILPEEFKTDTKKRKRTSRGSSTERPSKSRPQTPIAGSPATVARRRKLKSHSVDSPVTTSQSHSIVIVDAEKVHNLRIRTTQPDYGLGEEPFGFELSEPELSPFKDRTGKSMSALSYLNKTEVKGVPQKLFDADSPSRLLRSVASELVTSGQITSTSLPQAKLVVKRLPSPELTSEIESNFSFSGKASPKTPRSLSDVSFEMEVEHDRDIVDLTESGADSKLPKTTVSDSVSVTKLSDVITTISGTKPKFPETTEPNSGMKTTIPKSPPKLVTTIPETSHVRVPVSIPKTFDVGSDPQLKLTSQPSLTQAGLTTITSPIITHLRKSLDAGTPLSRIWTSGHECLTYPNQDLTKDVSTLRYRSIEAVAHLKDENPLQEFMDNERHEGDDVVLDDMEEYPFHVPSSRLTDKVDETMKYYRNSAYAPKFPPSLKANVAGCTPYGTNINVKRPVQSKSKSFPKNLNSMNLIQSEAIRLESNNRTLAKMAENDAHLMPALVNFMEQLIQDDGSEHTKKLNSVVNGLRTNMVMRENLIAENLGITTAVRRRDNIERITNKQSVVDYFVSRKLHDDEDVLIPVHEPSPNKDVAHS